MGGSNGGKAKPVIRGGAGRMLGGSRGGKAEPVIRGGVGGHRRRNVPERAFARGDEWKPRVPALTCLFSLSEEVAG